MKTILLVFILFFSVICFGQKAENQSVLIGQSREFIKTRLITNNYLFVDTLSNTNCDSYFYYKFYYSFLFDSKNKCTNYWLTTKPVNLYKALDVFYINNAVEIQRLEFLVTEGTGNKLLVTMRYDAQNKLYIFDIEPYKGNKNKNK